MVFATFDRHTSPEATSPLTNAAPAGLNSFVSSRLDKPNYPTTPGDTRLWVGFVATAGTEVTHADINGKPVPVSVYHEQGLPMFRFDLELPRGRPITVVLQLREPKVNGSRVVWRQPGVQPLQATVTGDRCR